MKFIPFIFFFICYGAQMFAQGPVLNWVRTFDNNNAHGMSLDNGRAVAVDESGNVYSAGLFNETIDLDPGPSEFLVTGGYYIENYGVYISKLSATGEFIWGKQLPILVEFSSIEITVDNNGNLYLTTELRDPTDMDPGAGERILSPIGAKDVFVVKLDPQGNLLWARNFGGSQFDTVCDPGAIAVDFNGDVLISGTFTKTVDFDPGPGTYTLTSTRHFEAFLVKLNSAGEFIWAKNFISPITSAAASSMLGDIHTDKQGNVAIAGTFRGECDFDPGPAVFGMRAGGDTDGFILKLDKNGTFLWARRFGNTAVNSVIIHNGISIDSRGFIYSTGGFIGTHDFDPGPATVNLTNKGVTDAFILVLSPNGEFVWVKQFGETEYNLGADLTHDFSDNLYMSGTFHGTINFDPDNTDLTLTDLAEEAVLLKFRSDATLSYAARFKKLSSAYMLPRRLAVDKPQNVYLTGYTYGAIDADPGPAEYQIDGIQRPYVMKLSPCPNNSYTTLTIETCEFYQAGKFRFDSSGTYIFSIPNSKGCDSIITLELTILKSSGSKTIEICEGDSYFAGGRFQNVPGIYSDTLENSKGCDSILITNLIIRPRPMPALGEDRVICENKDLVLDPGIFSHYQWSDGGTNRTNSTNETGLVWVTVINEYQCSGSDTLEIKSIQPNPADFLKQTDTLCRGANLSIYSMQPYESYYWSTGHSQQRIEIKKGGEYTLTVVDKNGCSGADTINIIEKECLSGVFIPTGFSPNGDGNNDFFRTITYGTLLQFSLSIYDRFGTLLFNTTDPRKSWDGSLRGTPLNTGNFVWVCTYQLENQDTQTQKGNLLLIR